MPVCVGYIKRKKILKTLSFNWFSRILLYADIWIWTYRTEQGSASPFKIRDCVKGHNKDKNDIPFTWVVATSTMRDFIKSAVKFPLKNCLHFAKLFSSIVVYFKGEQGSEMLTSKTQEHVSGGNNVGYWLFISWLLKKHRGRFSWKKSHYLKRLSIQINQSNHQRHSCHTQLTFYSRLSLSLLFFWSHGVCTTLEILWVLGGSGFSGESLKYHLFLVVPFYAFFFFWKALSDS